MENQIKLVQSPVITHKLQEAGREVTKRIGELELEKQVATVDTVKSLKELRAELNKELAEFEAQRKFIKEGVTNPYLAFENTYKTEISEKYKTAIDFLKDKIAFVEDKIKLDKKESIVIYFDELCICEKIDFIKFEKLGIEVNLSTTEKKYKEQINEYLTKVVDDLNLIKSTDFEAEILTEYKVSLNVSNAITTVKTRKEREQAETERLKSEQKVNRVNFLEKLGMRYVEITNAYEFNSDVYVTLSDVNNLSKEDFTTKYHDCEAEIKDLKAKELAFKLSETEPENGGEIIKQVEKIINAPVSPPVFAPVIEMESEPIKTASFEVRATMTQLRALGAYMKENNINYKNI